MPKIHHLGPLSLLYRVPPLIRCLVVNPYCIGMLDTSGSSIEAEAHPVPLAVRQNRLGAKSLLAAISIGDCDAVQKIVDSGKASQIICQMWCLGQHDLSEDMVT